MKAALISDNVLQANRHALHIWGRFYFRYTMNRRDRQLGNLEVRPNRAVPPNSQPCRAEALRQACLFARASECRLSERSSFMYLPQTAGIPDARRSVARQRGLAGLAHTPQSSRMATSGRNQRQLHEQSPTTPGSLCPQGSTSVGSLTTICHNCSREPGVKCGSLGSRGSQTFCSGFLVALLSFIVGLVALIVKGCKNREIALRPGTTEQVIKNYLCGVYDKTGVSDRLELALFSIHHRLLPAVPG
jgi:hypothetical protein